MNGASAAEPQYKSKWYMAHVSSSKVLALALLFGPKF